MYHPLIIKALTDPLDYIADFIKVGIVQKNNYYVFRNGNGLTETFLNKQVNIVRKDLEKCNKTAWLLPRYLAYSSHRDLRKAGKHSDVSRNAFTSPEIFFVYLSSYVPSSMLQRVSMIQTIGIVDWWPKFINRSEVIETKVNAFLAAPKMTGNILVVFTFLGGGMAFAITCMICELHQNTSNYLVKGCMFSVRK